MFVFDDLYLVEHVGPRWLIRAGQLCLNLRLCPACLALQVGLLNRKNGFLMDTSDEWLVDSTLDTSGLNCPEPVMLLHGRVRDLQGGQVLKVIATDPSTQRDIPKFCLFLEHELLEQKEAPGCYLYWIRKKAAG